MPLPISIVTIVPVVFPTGFAFALADPGIFIDELIPISDGCDLDAHNHALLGISLDDLVAFGLHIVKHMSLAVVESAQSIPVVVVADGGGGVMTGDGQ
jgi:hypothetical protein